MDLFVQTYKRKESDDNVDWISEVSDDVLLFILSKLPTEEAIRTSVVSKRWEHVWKKLPHLVLNTRRRFNPDAELTRVINNLGGDLESCEIIHLCGFTHYPHECVTFNSRKLRFSDDSNPDAELTRIINNHYGHLESCEITHYSNKGKHGLLETWIQTVQTRNLTLANRNERSLCSFRLCFFAHPKLISLSLKSYRLINSILFQNGSNIKILKLFSIFCHKVEVFNNILSSCPSLEVLILNFINCIHDKSFTLKIENSKLKFLEMYAINGINKIIVSAPSLDILVTRDVVSKSQYVSKNQCELLLQSPNLQFNRNSIGQTRWLHIIYNISKEENNGHEGLVNRIEEPMREIFPTLSVTVDLMNETEVERLRQVLLCLWSDTVDHFEINFKGNNVLSPNDEIECWQKKLWVDEDFFPNAKFRVDFLVIYNFKASKEEIAFVSCLIRQKKVERKILINSDLFSASNRSNIEAAVAKLKRVQFEAQQKVTIEYFRDLVNQNWLN